MCGNVTKLNEQLGRAKRDIIGPDYTIKKGALVYFKMLTNSNDICSVRLKNKFGLGISCVFIEDIEILEE